MQVRKGPRENRHRPAIDPLFRTAARAFGPNTIAVLLSGNLDDGSGGLLAVRTRRGIGIVQDPAEAQADEMPRRAMHYAGTDYVLPVKAIGPKLVELINSRAIAMKGSRKSKKPIKANGSDREIRRNERVFDRKQGGGTPSVFACPECHGVLWEVKEGHLTRFRCRVGHAYAPASLKSEMNQSSERALWAAMRALEEKAALGKRLLAAANGHPPQRLKEQTEADAANAEEIRRMIFALD
jgi:two-component system chemotaxis response regulator CheB